MSDEKNNGAVKVPSWMVRYGLPVLLGALLGGGGVGGFLGGKAVAPATPGFYQTAADAAAQELQNSKEHAKLQLQCSEGLGRIDERLKSQEQVLGDVQHDIKSLLRAMPRSTERQDP